MNENIQEEFVDHGDGTWSMVVGHGSPVEVILDVHVDACDIQVIEGANQDLIRYIGQAKSLDNAKLIGSYIAELHRKNIERPAIAD